MSSAAPSSPASVAKVVAAPNTSAQHREVAGDDRDARGQRLHGGESEALLGGGEGEDVGGGDQGRWFGVSHRAQENRVHAQRAARDSTCAR
jgi:hypothetical protein